MSNVTLMAGSPRSLCRAWHALQELERSRTDNCRAPGCPARSTNTNRNRRETDVNS